MINGIAILGLNGGGKSTLSHALAKKCGYLELDVEDCYFPEQSNSRKCALDDNVIETVHLGLLPFSNPRTKSEVEEGIIENIKDNTKFVLSGVTMNWNEAILSRINLAFWIQTPVEVRLKRLKAREVKRFGSRVLVGGDMFSQQQDFLKEVGNRDTKVIEESIMNLDCLIIEIDGMYSVEHNLEVIMETLKNTHK